MGDWGGEFAGWRQVSVAPFYADEGLYPWIDRGPRDEESA